MKETHAAEAKPYHHGDLRRALIDAALELVTEEQDWSFSLREVARRAGVSHNAPYNHFPEKRDLLGAVAAAGFETLRDRLAASIIGIKSARAALTACAKAYVQSGAENPALYRLMFGSALSVENGGSGAQRRGAASDKGRPAEARAAGAEAKAVLDGIILRGAQSGEFDISPTSKNDLALAALSGWSTVHGLTMLVIDDLTGSDLMLDTVVGRLMKRLLEGLEPR